MLERTGSRGEPTCVTRLGNGVVGPNQPSAGLIKSGDRICALTAPGCLGPIITPELHGGHEVAQSLMVDGAEVGDAVAIIIEQVKILSHASASGVHAERKGAFGDDPFVDKRCPGCGQPWPKTTVRGTGQEAIQCSNCGENAVSISMVEGYTAVFDDNRRVGISVDKPAAHALALNARENSALPASSKQNSILLFELSSLVGTVARLRPFVGNIGTSPSVDLPDSHNAGDLGYLLVGAKHAYGLTEEEMRLHTTDAHMDINVVTEGAILICPVKIPGAGIYMGDVHAVQGDGEVAGHTLDVSAEVVVKVELIKTLPIQGPVLLPGLDDLLPQARPYCAEELDIARKLAKKLNANIVESAGPIEVIGSGRTLNDATANAVSRAASFLDMSKEEVLNRCTITGGVRIGRLPGIVRLGLLVPLERLDQLGVGQLVRQAYQL